MNKRTVKRREELTERAEISNEAKVSRHELGTSKETVSHQS
jgi:hypothetical protein